jgi:hypothetical protein
MGQRACPLPLLSLPKWMLCGSGTTRLPLLDMPLPLVYHINEQTRVADHMFIYLAIIAQTYDNEKMSMIQHCFC